MRLLVLCTPSWLRDLAGAWVFYTVLPGLPWPNPQFNRIARFAPAIGVLTGAIQTSIWLLLAFTGWSKEALVFLTIAINPLITGGLHLDGLMDTADGIAAGPSKCLAAMKDSRVGAFGVQALIIVLFIQIAALIKLDSYSPIALPIATFWGRCSPLWAIEHFPYLNKHSKPSFHRLHWKGLNEYKPTIIILLLVFTTIIFTSLDAPIFLTLIIGISVGILPTLLVPDLIGRQLRGHNGDSYGACVVLVETFMLLLLAMFLP